MRREALVGMRDIGNRQSFLVLVSLLELTYLKDLKADWGWKGTPDFQKSFPDAIAMCMRQGTKRDIGKDRTKWTEWISKNVEPLNPVENQ